MNIEGKIAIIAITKNGENLAHEICDKLKNEKLDKDVSIHIVNRNLDEIVKNTFEQYDYIIFIMATGIVVRAISKYIKNKFEDPAILVIDEKGQNVISLLSGHMGGANEMTIKISDLINANPVITTATDVNNKSSLDMIAKKLDAYIENFRENVKDVNSLLVNDNKVLLYIDGDYELDTRGFKVIENLSNEKLEQLVFISNKKEILGVSKDLGNIDKIIKVVPRDIVIGIGCRKGTDSQLLYESLVDLLDKQNIDINAIKKIGSIDIKKDEKAINDLSERLGVPFESIGHDKIAEIEDLFEKSEFVKKNIGVYSVSEPVAYILSNGNLIVKKQKYKGITFSIGRIK